MHATSAVNANRDPKVVKKPIELPVPWDRDVSATDQVTDEERAKLRAELARRSAFASEN